MFEIITPNQGLIFLDKVFERIGYDKSANIKRVCEMDFQ